MRQVDEGQSALSPARGLVAKARRAGDLEAVASLSFGRDSTVLEIRLKRFGGRARTRVRLASMDGAALPDLTERLKVVRYPTLLLLYRERELARATGAMNLAQLLAWAQPHIAAVVTGPG